MIVEHGRVIGSYRDQPIHHDIVDDKGTRWKFDRIALEAEGGVPLSQLGPHEIVISPGLIYRCCSWTSASD